MCVCVCFLVLVSVFFFMRACIRIHYLFETYDLLICLFLLTAGFQFKFIDSKLKKAHRSAHESIVGFSTHKIMVNETKNNSWISMCVYAVHYF